MPLYTTEAIILRTYKLGEADRIVVFLTRDRGKRRGVAQGARRMRSRFGGALEPLTRVGVTYFEKESRELVSLNYAEPLSSPLWSVRADALGAHRVLRGAHRRVRARGRCRRALYRLGSSVVDALERRGGRSSRWPGTSSTGCCGCRACTRRSWRARPAGVSSGATRPTAAVLMPGERAVPVRAVRGPGGRAGGGAVGRGGVVSARLGAGRPGPRWSGLAPSPRALRELEAVHRTLIATHLEKDLKSARVLRELRGHS